jgi:3-oxoadipate enol-lactonase
MILPDALPFRVERIGPPPRIAVEVAGSGPFVLFLHGIGGTREQWRPQLDALAADFTVAAWDARGYGESDDYEGPLRFASFVDDVIRVLDHFKVTRTHLVGLSMGGRIAREVALAHPDRIDRLVLANTTPGFAALSEEAQRAFIEARSAPLRSGRTPAELAPVLVAKLVHPDASAAARAQAIAMMTGLHTGSYIKTVEASVAQDRSAPIEAIRAPTLVVTSDADPLYPASVAIDMARRIPGARLVTIEQCGHLSNLEKPEAFNAALRAFLLDDRRTD